MGFLKKLNEYLLVMGIPGLFVISFLDSAAVPMVGGPDAVVMLLSWKRPALFFLIAMTAALGSTLGCMVLYGIGKKGGEGVLARFEARKVAWIRQQMDEYGVGAVIMAVVAPPPFPTKPVILAAGVLQISRIPFALAVLAGRIVRYSIVGYLGARFGERAAQVLKAHYPTIGLSLAAVIILALMARHFIGKR